MPSKWTLIHVVWTKLSMKKNKYLRGKLIETPCLPCNSVSIKQEFLYVRTAMCMWVYIYVCANHRQKYINMSVNF
jgi:hypothetical protein